MNGSMRLIAALSLACMATGCAIIPPEPVVVGPLTASPPPGLPSSVPNGAIYQPAAYGSYPLFEDRRPRNVGDIVTVVLNERTNATKGGATTTSRDSKVSLAMDVTPKILPSGLDSKQNADISGANTMNGRGTTSANNRFNGTLTTTVIGLLPNGNLQIAGEKQIAINRGSEYIRFSGVIDPRTILGGNTVSSTQVADVRVEYRSKGTLDEAQTMGWLQRFFLNLSPL